MRRQRSLRNAGEFLDQQSSDRPFFPYLRHNGPCNLPRLCGDSPALYDLVNDPDKNRNVVNDPAHADLAADLDTPLEAFILEHAVGKYDVWRGGTAKALLTFNDRNEAFEETFPNWKPPGIGKIPAFSAR